MPAETVIVVAAVVAVFSVFGGLLGWATSIAGPAFPGHGKTSGSSVGSPGVGPFILAH
jgi:hypothetical protein